MRKKSRLSEWRPVLFDDFRHKDGVLTAEEHIACQRLVNHYWLTQKPLPDDDESLAVISGFRDQWESMRPAILPLFFRKTRQGWVPHHYEDELQHAIEVSKSKSKAGEASGESRRKKGTQKNTCSTPDEPVQNSTEQSTSRNMGLDGANEIEPFASENTGGAA